MTVRHSGRKQERVTEGALTFAVLGVLLTALVLVYFAPRRVEAPSDAPLLNEVKPDVLAARLAVDRAIADRLLAVRQRKGGFSSVDELLDVRLFDRADADRLITTLNASRLDCRTASASQFAHTLSLPRPIAERLAAWRDAELAGTGTAPDAGAVGSSEQATTTAPPTTTAPATPAPRLTAEGLLRHALALDPQLAGPRLAQFVLRTPAAAARRFQLCALILLLVVFLLPVLLRNRLRVGGDPFLLPLGLLLSGLGAVMLYSIKDPLRDVAAYEHHLVGLGVSLIAFLLMARLTPSARLRIKRTQYVWVFGAGLLVLLLFVFGRGPEGVKLNLLGFQPVELIKLMLVFFLASYLSDRADLITDASIPFTPKALQGAQRADGRRTFALALPRRQDLGPVAVLFGLALTLFYAIKDLGPGLLIFATFIALLYLTTGRAGFFTIGAVLLVAGGLLGYWRHIGVFGTRVDMWLSPFANHHPNGMQLGQATWALASGGWSGSGLGLGMPNLIPRGQDDLAFISWTEETGLPGALLMLSVYAVLIWRGVRIAIRAGNDFDRALAYGLTALLGLQTLLILGGVTGLCPLTGISLPFASYGDSALVAAWISVGLLRGISMPPPSGERFSIRPEVARAGRRFALCMALLLLGVVGGYRLVPTLCWNADALALRTVTTPDADHVMRPHSNPRLLAMAASIQRGSIYDRGGRILATSRPAEVQRLAPNPRVRADLYGNHARIYPYGPALAHLIGTLDTGIGGPSGFERYYNVELRGYDRLKDLLADYRDRYRPGYVPRRGRDLHLTLDAPLQRAVQRALERATAKLKDTRNNGRTKERAAFVLQDPRTGDVLVAATYPTYDPNTLTHDRYRRAMTTTDPEDPRPFINRAVNGYYPPGSTLKVATAAAALDSLPDAMRFAVACNQVDPNLRWEVDGKHYARTIRDDQGDPAFGTLTLARAFTVSSNIYFANLAVEVGVERLHAALADRMGFGHTPRPESFAPDLADIGYGQGRMLASPLEMARLAGAVANGGVMMRPRYVTSLTDPAGHDKKRVIAAGPLSQAMRPQTAAIVRELMRSVVTGGTARGVFDTLPVPVAGKTGTAQNHQLDHQPHSWFIGFAPYAAPRYAFSCVVENGGYGKRVAAVICRDVLKQLF